MSNVNVGLMPISFRKIYKVCDYMCKSNQNKTLSVPGCSLVLLLKSHKCSDATMTDVETELVRKKAPVNVN